MVIEKQNSPANQVPSVKIDFIRKKTDQMLENSRNYRISDAEGLSNAVFFVQEVKKLREEINNTFDPVIRLQHQAHIKTLEIKRKFSLPLDKAESILKGKMKEFHEEQEKVRTQKEEALREKARSEEENRRLEQARIAARSGNTEEAQILLNTPVITPFIRVSSETDNSGVSFRDTWKFEITDPSAVPDEYKIIDEKRIRAVVKALKNNTNIPGVRVYCDKTVATRRV